MARKLVNSDLSRRERQIMAVLHRRNGATILQIATGIPSAPTDGALRTLVNILVRKGHVTRHKAGRSFVYAPRVATYKAARSELRNVLYTFFGGSFGDAVAAHLADPSAILDDDDLKRISKMIQEARKGKG